MKHLFLIYLFALLITVTANLPGRAESNETALFKELIRINSMIQSIDADIEQYIKRPGHPVELFKGHYRAESTGSFRIDYHTPSRQIVIYRDNTLFWYYPEDKLLYQLGGGRKHHGSTKFNPLSEFSRDLERNFTIHYLGKHIYGLFLTVHQYIIRSKKSEHAVVLMIDKKRKVVRSKIYKSKLGKEIIKEIYEDFNKIGDIHFPTRIDVFAKAPNGVTRNTTYYKNIKLNRKFSKRVFIISVPRDVKRRYIK